MQSDRRCHTILSNFITSYHIMSHHIIPYHITSYHSIPIDPIPHDDGGGRDVVAEGLIGAAM